MKAINLIIIITLVAFLPLSVVAQTSVPDALAKKIQNQSYLKLQATADCSAPFISIEKRICANLEFQREQKEMDNLLKEILTFYTEEAMNDELKMLILEQIEWQSNRIENCVSQHGQYDENLISAHHLVTFTDITAQRRNDLAKAYQQLDAATMLFGAANKKDKDK